MISPSAGRKPKVCMVVYNESPTSLPPMFNGGISLARSGFEVEALCFTESEGGLLYEAYIPGFYAKRFRALVRKFFHAKFGLAPQNVALAGLQYASSYLEYVLKAFRVALKSKADLYVAHDLPTLLPTLVAGKVCGKPVVYHAHELWSEMHEKVQFAGVWRLLDRLLVPLCDVVVTPDEHLSMIYRDEFGAKNVPLTVHNCPPYREPMKSNRLREELNRRGVEFKTIVLYQGLVDSSRCIEEMAEASRRFNDGIILVIVGGGFKQWANPAEVLRTYENIVVLPRVAYEDLVPFTASADIGLLFYRNNCRNNYFCAPNKLHEYMMMGLPVVTCNYPGVRKVVESENVGYCVDPANPEQIAEAINRLAADPERAHQMKVNGLRAAAQKYNWEMEFTKLRSRYAELLPRTIVQDDEPADAVKTNSSGAGNIVVQEI
jgi:glycosyltransferase involved in cell wall biosynthesis